MICIILLYVIHDKVIASASIMIRLRKNEALSKLLVHLLSKYQTTGQRTTPPITQAHHQCLGHLRSAISEEGSGALLPVALERLRGGHARGSNRPTRGISPLGAAPRPRCLLVPSFRGNVDRKIQGTLTLGSKDTKKKIWELVGGWL